MDTFFSGLLFRQVNNQGHLAFLRGSHLTLSWLCVLLSQGVLVLSKQAVVS